MELASARASVLGYHSKRSAPTTKENMDVQGESPNIGSSVSEHPNPLVPLKVTHNSVELTWGSPTKPSSQRPCYTVEMEDCSTGGYVTVYR